MFYFILFLKRKTKIADGPALCRPGRDSGRAGTRVVRPLAGPGRGSGRSLRPVTGPSRERGRVQTGHAGQERGGHRRGNGRRRPISGGATRLCSHAIRVPVWAVLKRVLVSDGAAPGDGCVRDRPLPWRTAGRTSHDGEVVEQEEGGGDVPGDGVLTLSTWPWPATAGNGRRRRNRAGELAAEDDVEPPGTIRSTRR